MAIQREVIFAALFSRLESRLVDPDLADGKLFRYATRVFEGWDEMAPSQCPALQLRRGAESRPSALGRPGTPPIVSMGATIVIYAKQDEERQTPASVQLNALIDAVEACLERQPTDGPVDGAVFPQNPSYNYGTTLGGLCFSCQIVGTIETFEPITADGDAVVLIPVEILTTP